MSDWKNLQNITLVKLDEISPTFCLAKWVQVTLHLHHGHSHSCHHPIKHKIPLEELSKNDSALHNTIFKKVMRKKMLQGEAPQECRYCWALEQANSEHLSDRVIKSSESWALPLIDEIKKMSWDQDVIPKYLEVVFGSECNLACAYCAPDTSSRIYKEFLKYDAYPTSDPLYKLEDMKRFDRLPYLPNEKNPYIEAFWRWFPQVYPKLKVLRITGGEPLLNGNTFKLLKYLEENPRENLEIFINSNACVEDEIFQKFLQQVKKLKNIKFGFYVSVDTYGIQAEYIRYGLDYERLLKNVSLYHETIQRPVTFMCAFNLLSIPHFQKFLKDILKLKKKYGPYQTFLDISWVCHPMYFSPQLADSALKDILNADLAFMKENSESQIGEGGFIEYECSKMERLVSLVESDQLSESELKRWRKDFDLFFQEYDRRKKLSFKDTFPELVSFRQRIKDLV